MINLICKCGSNKNYLDCCGAFIVKNKLPQTPEQLMRSRYTAYVIGDIDYIAATMQDRALIGFDPKEAKLRSNETIWLKLEIIGTKQKNKNLGLVEFKVYYQEYGKDFIQHEISEFKLKNGKWFYVDGILCN